MNRQEFQRLAEVRLREAETLLRDGLWDGAYYLAGYAVECGLKACILARVGRQPELVFNEKDFSRRCFTHDLRTLLALADLTQDLDSVASPATKTNWQAATEWSEQSRYTSWDEASARKLVDAVANLTEGVLQWLRPHW